MLRDSLFLSVTSRHDCKSFDFMIQPKRNCSTLQMSYRLEKSRSGISSEYFSKKLDLLSFLSFFIYRKYDRFTIVEIFLISCPKFNLSFISFYVV